MVGTMTTTSKSANDNVEGESFPTGETREIGDWRIWRGACTAKAVHTLNAGKRGKRCDVVTIVDPPEEMAELIAQTMVLIAQIAQLDPTHAFAHPDYMGTRFEGRGFNVRRTTERGVDVTPVGCLPMNFESDRVRFRIELDGCSILDLKDVHNEQTMIPGESCGKRACARFYAWARKNTENLVRMSFHEVYENLRQQGISVHAYCAID